MRIKPWPHQSKAIKRAAAGNTLLAHEPGCGKTLVAARVAQEIGGRCLYLCPATLRLQVADELRRFRPTATIQVLKKGTDAVDSAADIVICSYEMAANVAIFKQLFALNWGTLILDEAHYLKNSGAKRTRAVYGARADSKGALFRRAVRTLPMTGTPIMNSPQDLWTHYSRLFPTALSTNGKPVSQAQWVDRFCLLRRTGFGEQIVGGKNLDELAALLRPYVDRVRKVDVLKDLPALTVDHAALQGDDIQLDKDADPLLIETLRTLTRDVHLGFEGLEPALATLRRRIGLLKVGPVAEYVANELEGGTKKVIVFGLHPEALEAIATKLNRYEPVTVTGATSMAARDGYVRCFQNEPSCRVFVGQLYAAGTGLNLQSADRVVFAEAAWTPAVNDQAIARAHRAGQLQAVRATFLSLRGSIDEDVQKALARKAATAWKVLDAAE
jgi:SWI/SNF-related matrix-associated actin-dependent regulator 1 of chromatin subfamily A